ncbi:MAG: hypothetical protein K2X25_10005 [Caulobacteraceae bacterium]|nr:hypothetical protein [Caulobacteraceae bacterium]
MIAASAAVLALLSTELPPGDVRAMIHDARQLIIRSGDTVWEGYSETPLPILLVEGSRETLFCAPVLQGFTPAGTDPVTGCTLQTRPRELPVDLAAASWLGDQPVIMMGLPDALEATRADWVITLLHETFHQYQAALPAYQPSVDQVGSRLGQTDVGWMLDYPFPYSRAEVGVAFGRMNRAALAWLEAPEDPEAGQRMTGYMQARRAARAIVGETDWLYYEFQAGQEGVARWSELTLADIAGRSDPDIAAVALDRRLGLATSLRAINDQGLAMWRRSSFYVLGAIEADMLERHRPDWKAAYRQTPFSMGALLEAAVASAEE